MVAVHTVFLMLIHDKGVRHPSIWQKYLALPQNEGSALCIHGDGKTPHSTYRRMGSLVRDHLLERTRVRVTWGDESMVDATVRALEEAMELHPNARHFVLCSGYDVPLKTIAQCGTFLGARHAKKTTYFPMLASRDNARYVRQAKDSATAQAEKDVLKQVTFHHQWMCICRSHARILVQNRQRVLETFRPVHQLLQAVSNLSPDEWYVIAALRAYGRVNNDELMQHVVCSAYVDQGQDHPITFTSLFRIVTLSGGESDEAQKSLLDVIEEVYEERRSARIDKTALLLRKVNIDHVAEEEALEKTLFALWTNPAANPRRHRTCMTEDVDKCFRTSRGCQRPNPWIEFRIDRKGRGMSMPVAVQTYRAAKLGQEDLLSAQPYVRQQPKPTTHAQITRHACSHTPGKRAGLATEFQTKASIMSREWFENDGKWFTAKVKGVSEFVKTQRAGVKDQEVASFIQTKLDRLDRIQEDVSNIKSVQLSISARNVTLELLSLIALYFAKLATLQQHIKAVLFSSATPIVESHVKEVNDVKDAVVNVLTTPPGCANGDKTACGPDGSRPWASADLNKDVSRMGLDVAEFSIMPVTRSYDDYMSAVATVSSSADEQVSVSRDAYDATGKDRAASVHVFVALWTKFSKAVKEFYLASYALTSFDDLEWEALQTASPRITVEDNKTIATLDAKAVFRNAWSIDVTRFSEFASRENVDDPLLKSVNKPNKIDTFVFVKEIDALFKNKPVADWKTALATWTAVNPKLRQSSLNIFVDTVVEHVVSHWANGLQVLSALNDRADNVNVRRDVHRIIKDRNARSIVTYVKVRNTSATDDFSDYNRRFNVLVQTDVDMNEPDAIILQTNEDDIPYYEIDNNKLGVTLEFQNKYADRIESVEPVGAYIDMKPVVPGGLLKQYDRTYVFGKFHKAFLPRDTNQQVAEGMTDVVNALQAGKNVFLVGYGASGAGKTSTLVYLDKPSIPADQRQGILVHLCNALGQKGFWKLAVSVKEFYASPDNGQIIEAGGDDHFSFEFVGGAYKLQQGEDGTRTLKRQHKYRSKEFSAAKTIDKTISLGELIMYLIDEDRLVKATTNNPNSSRSHSIVFIKLNHLNDTTKRPVIALGDFAGVENAFACREAAVKKAFATVKRQGTDAFFYATEGRDVDGTFDRDPIAGGGEGTCDKFIGSNHPLWDGKDLLARRPHPDADAESRLQTYYAKKQKTLRSEARNLWYEHHFESVLQHVFGDKKDVLDMKSEELKRTLDAASTSWRERVEAYQITCKNLMETGDKQNNKVWELFKRHHADKHAKYFTLADDAHDREKKALEDTFVFRRERLQREGYTITFDDITSDSKKLEAQQFDFFVLPDGGRLGTGLDTKIGYIWEDALYLYDCGRNRWLVVAKSRKNNDAKSKINRFETIQIRQSFTTKAKQMCEEYVAVLNKIKRQDDNKTQLDKVRIDPLNPVHDAFLTEVMGYEGTFSVDLAASIRAFIDELLAFASVRWSMATVSNDPRVLLTEFKKFLPTYFEPEDFDAMKDEYTIVANVLVETACRLEHAEYVCGRRLIEGRFINESLKQLRADIDKFLDAKEASNVNLTPASVAFCGDQYCKGVGMNKSCWKRRSNKESSSSFATTSLMRYVTEEFARHNPPSKTSDGAATPYDNMIMCMFCVFNASKDVGTNNPPPVPYIDINDIKRGFAQDMPLVDLNKMVVECFKRMDAFRTEKLIQLRPSIQDMQSYVQRSGDKATTMTEAVRRIYQTFIAAVDDHNAASPLGTLEYVDRLAKFNATEVVCGWRKEERADLESVLRKDGGIARLEDM